MEEKNETSMAQILREEQNKSDRHHYLTVEDTNSCSHYVKWQSWAIIGLLLFVVVSEVNRGIMNDRDKASKQTIVLLERSILQLKENLSYTLSSSEKIEEVLEKIETVTETMRDIPVFDTLGGS